MAQKKAFSAPACERPRHLQDVITCPRTRTRTSHIVRLISSFAAHAHTCYAPRRCQHREWRREWRLRTRHGTTDMTAAVLLVAWNGSGHGISVCFRAGRRAYIDMHALSWLALAGWLALAVVWLVWLADWLWCGCGVAGSGCGVAGWISILDLVAVAG